MKPLNQENDGENPDQYMQETARYEKSYPELCSEFLTNLAKSIKNTALYTLSHPLVIESLRKNCFILETIFQAKQDTAITLSFMNDSWLFNDTAVPAVTQESQNLNAFFKAHRLQGLTFLQGVASFEIGALCELLGAQIKNRPPGYINEFFAEKGVKNIKTEAVHYVKGSSYEPQTSAYQSPAPRPEPRPAPAASPVQQRQVPGPAPAASPVQQQRQAPRPAPAQAPLQQQRQAPRPAPVQQPRQPPWPTPPARHESPTAGDSKDLNAMFATPAAPGAGSAPAGEKPGQAQSGSKSNLDAMFGSSPAPGIAPGQAGEKAVQAPSADSKTQEKSLTSMSFGGILKGLVESAVKDPKERVRAYEEALKIMQQQVAESTREIEAEKEQALHTRARTETVLSKVADGKVIIDKDGKILMMNPAAEEIAGTKFADAVGKHITEQLRPGEHFLALSKDMDLSGGKIVSGEVELEGDEHMGRAMRRSVALLVDSDGRVVGELSTLPEMTKYKETQRMQEEFLSRVTHDLQSPLSSITSALEMLTEATSSKLDSVESNFLDISIRNSHRLSQMIRGILDFSKLQAGKMDIHLQPSALEPIVSEAVEGLTPWAKTKGVALSMRPISRDIYVMADAPRIVQVLTNLISNAIKATPEGGAVVVAAAPYPNQENYALVGIRDTGQGIAKEDLDKIFEKFTQLPSRRTQEGIGLGLAIVNDFLKLHNGKVWASSEVGKGSTFFFTLPLADREPQGF